MPVGPPLERAGLAAEQPLQGVLRHRLDLVHVGQTQLRQARRGLRSDAGQCLEGKSREKSLLPSGAHLHESPRLGAVGRHLGDHPVGSDPDAAIEPGIPPHLIAQALGDRQEGDGIEPFGAAEIEVGLVQRRHDDGRREALEHGPHRARGIPVMRKGAAEEGGLGTQADRLPDRHPRVNAEAARGVGGRLDDPAAVAPAAHDEQLDIAKLGVPLATYLDEERVEIDVEDTCRHGYLRRVLNDRRPRR